jgi:C_GCAxxG_C_C family probable redox protein
MKNDYEKVALEYFGNGFNCCESTLLVGCDILEVKDSLIPRIATCFGGGINGKGGACGLYTGAMMTIGIKYGRDTFNESRDPAQNKGREFHDFWMENMKKVDCRDLLDLDYPESITDSKDKKAYSTKNYCRPMCAKVAKWLEENL